MGVRGLTTYIYNNGDRFFTCYELHGTQLVIDGNCLASVLFQESVVSWSAFGGDYDRFAARIEEFFNVLRKCEVRPLVVFDGGYERRKLATTKMRNEGKVSVLKGISPAAHSLQCFPLMMRQSFRDKVSELGVPVAQSDFEADSEIAAVARQLDCPVLSNDSDFFIFDVRFVPLNGFPSQAERMKDGRWCLRCKLYSIDKFLGALGGLPKPLVPLMAVLLGNDYISRFVFSNFYKQSNLVNGRKRKHIHARVKSVIAWLKNKTFDGALSKILGHLRKWKKETVAMQTAQIISSYNVVSSPLLTYLVDSQLQPETPALSPGDIMYRYKHAEEADLEQELTTCGDCEATDSDGWSVGWTDSDQHSNDAEILDQPVISPSQQEEEHQIGISEHQGVHVEGSGGKRFRGAECIEENMNHEVVDKSMEVEKTTEEGSVDNGSKSEGSCIGVKRNWQKQSRAERRPQDALDLLRSKMPNWFIQNSRKGLMPSSLTTLLTLETYFCTPQVEEYSSPHAGQIGLPVLQRIAGILVDRRFFNYYHRSGFGYTNRRLKALPENVSVYEVEALTEEVRMAELCRVFKVDYTSVLEEFPTSWRLLVIGFVFWGNNIVSSPFTECHLHAVVFMAVCIGLVGEKIGYMRNRRPFMRRFGSRLKRPVEVVEPSSQWDVPEDHCIRALGAVLEFFQIEERLKTNPKPFCKATVHAFSELQTCLELLVMLNSVLLFPFDHFVAHKFYNGTFLYNVFNSFKKRADVSSYLKNLLKDCPTIYAVHDFIYKSLVSLVPIKPSHVTLKRKRKKRKYSQSMDAPVVSLPKADSSSEFSDEDNKFSILKKLSIDA